MINIYHNTTVGQALTALDKPRAGTWILSVAPDEAELQQLADTYALDYDTLKDVLDIYETPRVETEDGAVYIFTRYCRPEGDEVATEPLLLVYAHDYLITVLRIKNPIIDRLTSGSQTVLTHHKTETLLQIFSEINNSYERQVRKVSRQILQYRAQMRQSTLSTREFIGFIEIEEDLTEFLSALQPQEALLRSLLQGKYLKLHEDDRDAMEDLGRSTSELIIQVQGRLRTLVNMRQAYDAIATTNLNKTFKRLTSIAIFLTIPTIISGLWGMNLTVPFEHARHAFTGIVLAVSLITGSVVYYFSRKKLL